VGVGRRALEGLAVTDAWSGRCVLVTGATGLVGSALVPALLKKGARVVALIRDQDPQSELFRSGAVQRVHVVSGRLEDLADCERAIVDQETDTVFHLGAQTQVRTANQSPHATLEANVRGTYNLLEAVRRQKDVVQRVVVASSDKAYGTSPVLPYVEDQPLRGEHPYDVSKSCADLIATAYFHSYRLPIVIARCGNIYGAGDLNFQRLVPGTIRSLLRGERPIIRSDGTFRRDYVHLDDVVAAYLRMAEGIDDAGAAGRAYNFGPGTSHTVLEVVDAICDVVGRKDLAPVVQNKAVGEIRDQHLDPSRAAAELGLKTTIDLREGLRRTLPWYRAYLGAP
jgi:CDP-glucose 4,6-dehydratase